MSLLYIDCRTDDSPCLHSGDFGIGHCQTASPVSHHGIEFMQARDIILDLLNRPALCVCQLLNVCLLGGNKLMKRRIKEADGNRISLQRLINLLKVTLLVRKNLLQGSFSLFHGIGTDHLTESSNSALFKEHMLGTAKADTLGAKFSCLSCVRRRVCICSYFQSSVFVGPCHNSAKFTGDGGIHGGNSAVIDVACGSVNGDIISLMVLLACQCEFLVFLIHGDVAAAGYTAGSHSAGNHCRMGSHSAADGQDTLGSLHTCNIFRRCLQTDQYHLLAPCSPAFSIFRAEHHFTAGSSR